MIVNTKDIYKRHLFAFIFGPMLKMVEAIFDLLIPLFMKAVIDLCFNTTNDVITTTLGNFIKFFGSWVSNEYINYALIGGTIILIMGILGFLVTMITQYIAAVTSVKVGSELKDTLYKKILSLSKREIEIFGSEKLLTVLNVDSYQVQQGTLFFIRLIIRAPFIIIGSLIISFILDWQIGLVFLAIVPLILLIVLVIMRKSSKQYLSIQSRLDDISLITSDDIIGAKAIRAFNKEEYEEKKFAASSDKYQAEAIKVSKINSLINPITFAIISIAIILVVLLGSNALAKEITFFGNKLLPSTIITEVAYLDQIFQTLVILTNLVLVLTKSAVSRVRVNEVLALKPIIVDDENGICKKIEDGEEIIRFDDVSLAYQAGGNYTLKNVSFTLNKGDSLGIIGGTGSGKSTIISLIDRFIDATSGTIYYKGIDIRDYRLKQLRNEVGLVMQKSSLFKGNILSNMKMAKNDASEMEIEKALKCAQAYEFVSKYDDYLNHEVEESGLNFSGGQRQRLAIARTLLKDNEILILDDSTSALDLLTDKKVRENISSSYPNLTKIIVSQRVTTISDCDLILVVDSGKIIASGKHEELLKTCDAYLEIYYSQTNKGDIL